MAAWSLSLAAVLLAGIAPHAAFAFQEDGAIQDDGAAQDGAYAAPIDGMATISYGWSPFPGFSPNDCCWTCRNAWEGYCEEKHAECYHHAAHACGGLRCRIAGWLHPACSACPSGPCDGGNCCDGGGCCDSECDRCAPAPCCGHRCGHHLLSLFGLLGHDACCDATCGDSSCCHGESAPAAEDGPASEPPIPDAPEVPASNGAI